MRAVRGVLLPPRDPGDSGDDDERGRKPADPDPQPARPRAAVAVGALSARPEKRPFALVEIVGALLLPHRQARPAKQQPLIGSLRALPLAGGIGQQAPLAQPLAVLLDPCAQLRPAADQR